MNDALEELREQLRDEIMDGYRRGRVDSLRAALTTFEHIGDERAAEILRAMLDAARSDASSS